MEIEKTVTFKMNKCLKCGYEWIGRTGHPRACPNCKRYDWDKIANASLPLGK